MSQFIEMFGGIQNNTKWPLKSIGEICEMVNGYTFKSTKYSNQGYSIIRIANVQKGIIEDEDKVYYPEEYKSEFAESILKEGDILMSLTGNVGRVGVIYEQHLPAALNQRVQGLRIKDSSQINHQYLFSLLNLDDFETLCIKNASGSAQLNLSTVWLRNCKIVCPPIQEQEHFAKIAKQADKSKFVGFKSQFIEMFFSGKRAAEKLRKHIEVIRGVSYKPSDVYETICESSSIVLRSNNIDGGQINFEDLVFVASERVSEQQLLSAGDIVMCGSNGSKKLVGKAAMLQETPKARTSFGAFCLGIRCKSTLVPEYLATYFQTSLYREKIEALGSGSNILNIKPDHIYDLEVSIPSYDEQKAFVSIVKQADKSKYIS